MHDSIEKKINLRKQFAIFNKYIYVFFQIIKGKSEHFALQNVACKQAIGLFFPIHCC